MMATTMKATKAAALAAAKRKWGKRAFVEERRSAASAERREALHERRREINARLAEIEEAMNAIDKSWQRNLVQAARFVLDVDGEKPSIEQMRPLVEMAEQHYDLSEERAELRKEREGFNDYMKRWGAGWVSDSAVFQCAHVAVQADTLPELIEKIERA